MDCYDVSWLVSQSVSQSVRESVKDSHGTGRERTTQLITAGERSRWTRVKASLFHHVMDAWVWIIMRGCGMTMDEGRLS